MVDPRLRALTEASSADILDEQALASEGMWFDPDADPGDTEAMEPGDPRAKPADKRRGPRRGR